MVRKIKIFIDIKKTMCRPHLKVWCEQALVFRMIQNLKLKTTTTL